MEIRANYLLVGMFTLAGIVVFAAYFIWIAKSSADFAEIQYRIEFQGDVSGLSIGRPVLFNGIPVGSVKQLRISPEDSSKVEVLINVQEDLPVRADSEASRVVRGLTGQAAIMISSGNSSSPLLVDVSQHWPPLIKSRDSDLEQAFQSLPQILAEAKITFKAINELLSPENKEYFDNIIANTSEISENVKKSTAELDTLLKNMDRTTKNANKLIVEFQGTAQVLNETMSVAGPGIVRFSSDGLDEFRSLLAQTNHLVSNLNRMTKKMEAAPRQFFFGTQLQEYDGK